MRAKTFFAFTFLGAVFSLAVAADEPLPFVSPIFGDHMVLQRGKPNKIWGWSKPGETVRVTLGQRSKKTQVAPDGRWEVAIEPPAPGGPCTVVIDGPQHAELHDVLVGDVWLCGGQSNMEMGLAGVRDATNEVNAAHQPNLRLFVVRSHVSYSPAALPQGTWKVCSPETVSGRGGGFSAVAYFFGKKLEKEMHVPVGLIQDCLGGTPAEAWTSAAAVRTLHDFDTQLDELARLKARGAPEYGNFINHWYDDYDRGQKENWAAAGFDDSAWKTAQIPGGFTELGVPETPAVCWFRKTVTLPDPLPPGRASISLGVVERMDTTFVNGQSVGASAWVENPRHYFLRDGGLKPGTNVIAVRVFKTKPAGGFLSPPDDLFLTLGDGAKIPLAGAWRGALSVDARPPQPLPLAFENWPVMPAVLHQGMLQPLAPLAITGAIWYQGEQNSDRAWQYRKVLPAMIADWRQLFGQGDFPFYIAQLPAFMEHQDHPADSTWAELREAQAFTAQTVRHCAVAVTIDTGEADNIHPKEKRPVGERLALCALAEHYGKKVTFQGPTLKSTKNIPGGLKIYLDHTDGGLVAKNGRLEEFSVAGADRKWFWADAKIEGDAVVVSSPNVPEPKAVRYAWQSNPNATLFNGAGLPAGPFRTDDWPLTTLGKK